MNYRSVCVSVVLLFFSMLLFPQSLTLILIQEDSSTQNIRETTKQLESAIMDSFFNEGFIITNEPILIEDGTKEEFTERLASAGNGGVSCIIPVTVCYQSGLEEKETNFAQSVASVNWEILTDGYTQRAKGSAKPKVVKNTGLGSIERDIQLFSENLVSEIGTTIKKL